MNTILLVIVIACIFLFMGYAIKTGNKTSSRNTDSHFFGTYMFINESRCIDKTIFKEKEKRVTPKKHFEMLDTLTLKMTTGLAPVIAAGVVKAGIDVIGSGLQKIAEDKEIKTTTIFNISSLNSISNAEKSHPVCIQIVRAKFQVTSKKSDDAYPLNAGSLHTSWLKVVDGSEELFIEILPIIHENMLTLVPVELRCDGLLNTKFYSSKTRNIALHIGFAKPDEDLMEGKFSGGRTINFGEFDFKKTNPLKKEYYIKNEKSNTTNLFLANQTQWLGLDENATKKPVTLGGILIETKKASQFSKFMAKAFEASKDDLKSTASTAIKQLDIFKTSEELKAEKLKIKQEKLKNKENYLDAMATVLENKEKIGELINQEGEKPSGSAIQKAKIQYLTSMIDANLKAEIAGETPPYEKEVKTFQVNEKCEF